MSSLEVTDQIASDLEEKNIQSSIKCAQRGRKMLIKTDF